MNPSQLPPIFLREMQELLKSEYSDWLAQFEQPWHPGLRANALKLSPGELQKLLPWQLEPVQWIEEGFYYTDPSLRPARHPAYYGGLYYLQEPSAMTPAAMLPVEPGDRVLDLCAAPGGKSTQLAARLQGKGLLVSNDVSASRARALLKNLELAGAANICVTGETPERLAEQWPEYFDKILVDAPCSGEGMFRREPEMVRAWLEKGPDYYSPIQRQILEKAVEMLRPGGLLLFSTCTFSRKENEGTVQALLETCRSMELVSLDLHRVPGSVDLEELPGCMRLFPHRVKGEGHFLALLHKKEARAGAGIRSERSPFKRQKLSGELEEWVRRLSLDEERIYIRQGSVYLLPENFTPPAGLRFLRTGLLLGELKKERFEPSQALAMALKREQFSPCLDFAMEDPQVIRYLKGETLMPEGENAFKGWSLVCAAGYPLGWAKGNGPSLKNKYYPGWRWQ